MTMIAAANGNLFSVITTGAPPPLALRTLLGLPPRGETHLDYAAATDTQRNIWATHLDQAVLRAEKPVLLVASGASCFATAWWARLSPGDYVSRIAGALLFDPLERDDEPELQARFASPRIALPFPSVVLGGRRTSGQASERTMALAEDWGSGVARFPGFARRAGAQWRVAHDAVTRATARIVERRMRVADALGIPLQDNP